MGLVAVHCQCWVLVLAMVVASVLVLLPLLLVAMARADMIVSSIVVAVCQQFS